MNTFAVDGSTTGKMVPDLLWVSVFGFFQHEAAESLDETSSLGPG
jgi:hypothetical protein